MATSIMIGQKALFGLPPLPPDAGDIASASIEENIFTYALPIQLKIIDKDSRKKGKVSKAFGNGLDVYKVSKVRTL